jgi:hypothetical protein
VRLIPKSLLIALIALLGFGVWHRTIGNADFMADCSPEDRINTPEQAIAFAKQLISPQGKPSDVRKFVSPEDYVAAIEADPTCCSGGYGKRVAEGGAAGWGWSVTRKHLATQYEHLVEFNSCREVSYYGGMSLR